MLPWLHQVCHGGGTLPADSVSGHWSSPWQTHLLDSAPYICQFWCNKGHTPWVWASPRAAHWGNNGNLQHGSRQVTQQHSLSLCPHLTITHCALSIIKSLFSWNWQSAMLSCGDELLNLPLGLLQPYAICVPDFNHANGHPVGMNQGIFGALSMFWDTKTANVDVCGIFWVLAFVLELILGLLEKWTNILVVPHHNPLHCPVVLLPSCFISCLTREVLWARSQVGIGLMHYHGVGYVWLLFWCPFVCSCVLSLGPSCVWSSSWQAYDRQWLVQDV